MGKPLNPQQVPKSSVVKMPTRLEEIYHWLHDELVWLHIKWADFRRLYATSPERLNLLNAVAPAFFHDLQRMIWEDVLLHLCRLTDPPQSAGRDNLTIRRIPDAIPNRALRRVLNRLVGDANQKTKFARDWRNRRLAHQELPTSQGRVAAPLATINLQNVEAALAAIREAMNRIERHYLNQRVLYQHPIEALGGVETLVARLAKGMATQRAERARKLGG